MFANYTRATNQNGLYFYSKDILENEYVFSNDTQVTLNSDYFNNGVGLVIIDKTTPEENVFVFKISNYLFEVIHKNYKEQKRVYSASHTYKTPIDNFTMHFEKIGNKVLVKDNKEDILGEYNFPSDVDNYSFGIYSNKGNKVNDLSISSSVPNRWIANINNTNGGRIEFVSNGFIVEGCQHNAEIEQSNILLPKGRYFLKYESEKRKGLCDIVPYIFFSDSEIIDVKDKNLLLYDGDNAYIELEEDSEINIRFEGKNGLISRIAIVGGIGESFVPTDSKTNPRGGGALKVLRQEDTKKMIISASISATLENDINKNILIKGKDGFIHTHAVEGIRNNETHRYIIDFENNMLCIKNNNDHELAMSKDVETIISDYVSQDNFEMFLNLNVVISSIVVIYKDGSQEDLMVQQTKKYYIPGSIKSPIIATYNNAPLDISSSYRILKKGNRSIYKFTNREREVFKDTNILELNSIPSSIGNAIYIYGIPKKAKTDISRIYNTENGIEDISAYADIFDVIPFNNEYYYPNSNVIRLPEDYNYKEYIVDYLKEDSYCVNYDFKRKQYEVDISSRKDNIDIYFDYNNTITSGHGKESQYLVLSD